MRVRERLTRVGERLMRVGERLMRVGERLMRVGERLMRVRERLKRVDWKLPDDFSNSGLSGRIRELGPARNEVVGAGERACPVHLSADPDTARLLDIVASRRAPRVCGPFVRIRVTDLASGQMCEVTTLPFALTP